MEVDHSSPLVLDASIRSVKFTLATAEEIRTYSINDSPVSHPSQLTNPFLGLPLETGKCESCGTVENGECEGHFGYIPLIIPVYHPCHITELKNILSLVCLKCMRMKKGKVKSIPGKEKVFTTSCFFCRDLPPMSVVEDKTADGAFRLELRLPSKTRLRVGFWNFLEKFGFRYGDDLCRSLLPIEVLKILKEIPEETKRKLAGKGFFLQDGFILQYLPVPPNCLYVPEVSDGKSIMSSDISISLLKRVLNKNELIKRARSGIPNFESHEIESNDLQSFISQYLHLRGTTKAPQDTRNRFLVSNDVAEYSAKRWLEKMKTLFISKGSGFSSRSVICGDAYIGINVIGLPLEIAEKITYEERVAEYNIQRLQNIVDNRLCVTYRDGSSTYAISVGSKGHTNLKVGQIVNRRIMDGDIVFINRPPSTHKHSLQAFSVFIHDDHTVKINPLVCAPFGADFDGDCIHIFYPQSLAAKAEVQELFNIEKQLLSSHSGVLNLPLVHDSLLSLKMMVNRSFLTKATAQQLGMFVSWDLPPPALVKAHNGGPLWTVSQILQGALPSKFDSVGVRHLIRNSEILNLDLDRSILQSVFTDIVTSIVVDRGSRDALHFLNLVQPLLMETLFLDGYSLDLGHFNVPKDVIKDLQHSIQKISRVLEQLRWTYNDLVDKQVEDHLKNIKRPIVRFITSSSALGDLVDPKSESSVQKVVEQIGLLGIQVSDRGKLYSKSLVDDLFQHFVTKYCDTKTDLPSEAYGLINNSFFHGLNPFEEMIHSVASREVIVRSSRGLTEPGTLFKNLMAILRDVSIAYDGTVRNVCSNSIVQFQYGVDAPAGEPVGVLAATAISTPAYKAVLDSSRSTNSSWELMKEILLCRANFKNGDVDRRLILYLNDCCCGKKFCKENAAFAVQNCLKSVTLKDCAVDFSIEYNNQIILHDNSEPISGLVGHIHLDQTRLNMLNQSIDGILGKCQDVIFRYGKKKGQLAHYFRRISLSSSECCSFQQPNQRPLSLIPCLQFSYCDADPNRGPLESTIQFMADAICPILLDTIIKGDPQVHAANIVWVGPDTYGWVRNSSKNFKGELAVEVVIKKEAVRQNGDAWRIVMDACLPVMHLIDTRRCIPYDIQQIQELLGISCAFDQSVQRLSASIKMVAKGVLKEHLILVANNMTCTGGLIGFNTGGYKALFRALKVRVPFTEATLSTPMKCFERAAEKLHTDSLASVVSSCSWGKHVAVGTGAPFQVMWGTRCTSEILNNQACGENVYDFLELVRPPPHEEELSGAYLGTDVDKLAEEDEDNQLCLSPEPSCAFGEPVFDDVIDVDRDTENRVGKSSWDSDTGGAKWDVSTGWGTGKPSDLQITKPGAWSSWYADRVQQRPIEPKDVDNTSAKKSNEHSCWTENISKTKDLDNTSAKKPNEHSCWAENISKTKALQAEKSPGWDSKVTKNSQGQPNCWAEDVPKNRAAEPDRTPEWNSKATVNAESQTSWSSKNLNGWSTVKSLDGPSFSKPKADGWSAVKSLDGTSCSKTETDGWRHKDTVQHGWDVAEGSTKDAWDQNGKVRPSYLESNEDASPSLCKSNIWEGLESQKAMRQRSPNSGKWEENKENSAKNHAWARGWGSSDAGGRKFQKNYSARSPASFDDRKGRNANTTFSSTGRQPVFFTCEEEKILAEVNPIMQTIRKILRESSDGGRLSTDDQNYVIENVFKHHPDKEAKVTDQIDYMMVDRHKIFQDSRCFYIVSSDGSSHDFSYLKCMENYVKQNFPEHGDSFIGKYFKRRRSESGNENGQQKQQQRQQ